jgi:hypothetical protein
MTVKSIFVPESYLREEIRVGYDQAGGEATEAADAAEEVSPVVFKPVEPESEESGDAADAAEEPTTEGGDSRPSAFIADDEEEPLERRDDLEDADPVPEPETTDLFDGLNDKNFDAIDNLGEPQPEASGGGLFGNDFTTVLQTLMVSGNNMPVADILEDGVYELNAIKSYLDSIAQSLAKIADKYAGDSGYGNSKRDRNDRGNKPWNNDRGNKGKQSWNDRGRQDQQVDADPEAAIEDGLDE